MNIIKLTQTGRLTSITDIVRSIYPEGVSNKLIKVAHLELFYDLLKFEIASSVRYSLQIYGKGSTLRILFEAFKET